MLLRLIDDINRALDNDAYLAALSSALTLPDICGKAMYPNAKNGRRYIDWYNEYIGQYEQRPCENCKDSQLPYLSGEVVYNLRNSLLHQGTPNIDSGRINDEVNRIDEFVLAIEKKNEFDIYADASCAEESFFNGESTGVRRKYRVNVRRLCLILTQAAKNYYLRHKDKFNFFNYTVLDWDKEIEQMRRWKGELLNNDNNRKTL